MSFTGRKIAEGASVLYRFWIWPWIRAYKELKTHSVMKQRSYIPGTGIEGRNFVGKNAVLKNCTLGYFSIVQGGSDITDSDIGRYTTIGSDVKTVIGSHPTEKFVSIHPAFYSTKVVSEHTYVKQDRFQEKPSERTRIGSDVWIGSNVLIMGGVNIGDGAVVGAGAVVTADLPPFSINVGIPAKTIKYRFTEEQREKLLADKWWEKDEGWILSNIDRFSDVEEFVK